MAKHNKSYRIRTTVGRETDSYLDVHLDQDYDSLEILSLKISDKDTYKLHNSDYGVVVGRVLANGNFGVPNAKISVFIAADEQNSSLEMWNLYPYTTTSTKNDKDIRYNLLPDESVKDCHKAVGTFPHKTYLLENDALLEVFDKYYIYTTRTNAAGDYLICGVPTGMQTLHMDLDLSDCGILSQRPRDFVYKGYTIEQFENPNQFKKDENIDGLSQIFSQDQPVYVQPFWGNEDNGEEIGITRADIEISFKFEPTCVFMGSAISDNASNGISKKCVPTNQMGAMDELTAGEGTIEMIRKTPAGNVEEFAIKGNQVIDGNGVWCYQIPMNLDYMMTDEYGNMVPTDDPEKGIPTRTRVRFRASLTDMEDNSQSYYRAKYLIPNNPDIDADNVDYNFGTYTDESSYRDLFWNGVYTVKSYIPRFQKSKRWKSERFSGIKSCNYYGGNNPVPYNNMRIKLPFMFTVLCIFVKLFIRMVALVNRLEAALIRMTVGLINVFTGFITWLLKKFGINLTSAIINYGIKKYGAHCVFIGDGLCPDMEGWYFAPACGVGVDDDIKETLMNNTLAAAISNGNNSGVSDGKSKKALESTEYIDETSIDSQNITSLEQETACLTTNIDYLLNCFEMNLAEEYRVIKFDFYNDWVNGVLYFPRWMRKIKRKKKYKFSFRDGISTYYKDKVLGCMNADNSRVKKSRYYTQQCSLSYTGTPNTPWVNVTTDQNCYNKEKRSRFSSIRIIPSRCHKSEGIDRSSIFGPKSGLVTEETTMLGQYVYYLKPCEWKETTDGKKRTLLFATDIVLLGTLNDCDENGIPQAFKFLTNSSYIMPTNLALTTMDDDAYIYAPDDETVCSSDKNGSKHQSYDEVLRVTPDYNSTYTAYSKTDGDEIVYGENDDPVPVTEAAGISWNYSGPGQDDVKGGFFEPSSNLLNRLFGAGNKRYNYLYYPGGHFLGLSCVNSDSNIKSCVNLKRICELGATMSQRREEIRAYTRDENGEVVPKYRYYVPTGLISNVDIEAASFRSMFASLNHNKLIATETNDVTGYKKYNFRFLRPDGFDGLLDEYVHKAGSPYNKVVNSDGVESVVDSTSFFHNIFGVLWGEPLDYDPQEAEYTERRTVEDSIDDYYMFRFGLDTFADIEQKKHYLLKENNSYSLPQYENSFYFYFGLKDGATALDEFKKQFFSECEANTVARSPEIYVKENVSEKEEGGTKTMVLSAKLMIENMSPGFTITLKDNTTGDEDGPFTTDDDTVSLVQGENPAIENVVIEIGHEYTVTVTDSFGRTMSETFVYGTSSIRSDASTVHFRREGSTATSTAKQGGYIKINKNVVILKNQQTISSSDVEIRKVENGTESTVTANSEEYEDASGENWILFHVPGVGKYNVYVKYGGEDILIYTTTLDDNKKVNLFTSTNYLAYKKEPNPNDNNVTYYNNKVLSGITDTEWHNGDPFTGTSVDSWLMRHTYYRQSANNNLAYNNMIFTTGGYNIAIFGQPESGNLVCGGTVNPDGTFYKGDYDSYQGYFLDETYSYYPTMYWDGHDENTGTTRGRNTFDAMAYTEDGRAAADASTATINSYAYNNGTVTLGVTNTGNVLMDGHGCIVVLESGLKLFLVLHGNNLVGKVSYDIYGSIPTAKRNTLLSMATVYPTLEVPTIYKPFHASISAATWNTQNLAMDFDADETMQPTKFYLPLSYKVEGTIYNGLTYNNKFYSGASSESYNTYLIFPGKSDFYNALSAYTTGDSVSKREIKFGGNNSSSAFARVVTDESDAALPVTEITYSISEGTPPDENLSGRVKTQRYSTGIDREVLSDSCALTTVFRDSLYLKVHNAASGTSGDCSVYADGFDVTDVKYYIVKTGSSVFDDKGVLSGVDENVTFAYGYYNERSYGEKGKVFPVTISGNRYSFPYANQNGTTTTKTASTEANVYASGVSMAHKFVLSGTYINNITAITALLTASTTLQDITLTTQNRTGTKFVGNDYEALIAVYEKPSAGSMNKMVVYKLYPLKSFDLRFPLSGEVEPEPEPEGDDNSE